MWLKKLIPVGLSKTVGSLYSTAKNYVMVALLSLVLVLGILCLYLVNRSDDLKDTISELRTSLDTAVSTNESLSEELNRQIAISDAGNRHLLEKYDKLQEITNKYDAARGRLDAMLNSSEALKYLCEQNVEVLERNNNSLVKDNLELTKALASGEKLTDTETKDAIVYLKTRIPDVIKNTLNSTKNPFKPSVLQ